MRFLLRQPARLVEDLVHGLVGVPHDPDGESALSHVLADGVGELLEVAGLEAGERRDLLEGRPDPHPQLPVARVGVELLAVALRPGPEEEHGVVAVASSVG